MGLVGCHDRKFKPHVVEQMFDRSALRICATNPYLNVVALGRLRRYVRPVMLRADELNWFRHTLALASWYSRADAADRITYSVINLILYPAMARPSSGHDHFHSFSWPDVGTRSVWFNARSSLRPATASWRWQTVASSATTSVRFGSACRPASQAYRWLGHYSRPLRTLTCRFFAPRCGRSAFFLEV